MSVPPPPSPRVDRMVMPPNQLMDFNGALSAKWRNIRAVLGVIHLVERLSDDALLHISRFRRYAIERAH